MVDFAKNIEMRGNVTSGMDRITNVPRASVYRVAAQVVSSGVLFPAGFDTAEYDTDGMFSSSSSSLTCRTAGLYRVTGWWTWAASATTSRGLLIYRTPTTGAQTLYPGGGAAGEGATINGAPGVSFTAHGPLSYDIPLNAGDTVTMRVSQFTGGNLSIVPATAADRYNGFQACLISTI